MGDARSYDAGEIWYLMDTQYYFVTKIDVKLIAKRDRVDIPICHSKLYWKSIRGCQKENLKLD